MDQANFVAINTIHVRPDYVARFEELFSSRAHAIDRMPGFLSMNVLRPESPEDGYLVVSHWASKDAFESWTHSPEFLEGHKRAFADLAKAKEAGDEPPMRSDFRIYDVLAN